MFEMIKKILEASLGAVTITQEKLKELADELIVQGNLSKKEGADLLDELKQSAETGQNKIRILIEDQVHKVIREMGLASAQDIKAINGRIEALEFKLSKKKSSS